MLLRLTLLVDIVKDALGPPTHKVAPNGINPLGATWRVSHRMWGYHFPKALGGSEGI
ncbi:hypothetical protein GALMADRAFT_231965 [Galerina marginata CBS 339.88]|uniref:Uncharacterized protein n=1 Tax=Galerina marginata (strain CBS 339.88) TaxID=685588 RepID=A0A067SL98_GALM3|nr:hypothetical protein GALMADRAFT_231965 [Galerina marginata CBS 339.88]